MGLLGKKIKDMQKQRNRERAQAKAEIKKMSGDPMKKCPLCGANIRYMNPSQKANHIDRCM